MLYRDVLAEKYGDQCILSNLLMWLELEASLPGLPFDFTAPGAFEASEDFLEKQIRKSQLEYITASICFRQARLAYGRSIALLARRETARQRQINNLPPVSRLSGDILSCIFELSENPLILSHICHRWRAVAISTSSLWSHLGKEVGELDSPRAITYLQRSGNYPLRIDLLRINHPDLLVPFLPRIKVLKIGVMNDQGIAEFLNIPAPLLEALHVSDDQLKHRDPSAPTLFSNEAPKLQVVRFRRIQFVAFPTQSITELFLERCILPHPKLIVDFLQSIPNLRSLSLDDNFTSSLIANNPISPWITNNPVPPKCHLPSLRTLHFGQAQQNTGFQIIAPGIEHLHLLHHWGESSFLLRPNPSLPHLSLSDLQPIEFKITQTRPFNSWFDYVQEHVQVLSLHMGKFHSLRSIFRMLSESSSGPPTTFYFPRLEKLEFKIWTSTLPDDLRDLLRLVDIRKKASVPIKTVSVEGRWKINDIWAPEEIAFLHQNSVQLLECAGCDASEQFPPISSLEAGMDEADSSEYDSDEDL